MARHSYIGSGRDYVHYSNEQLSEIRETDMLDFLFRREGYTFQKQGHYYRCKEHDSLVIYPDRKLWIWNSHDLKGLNVIDWLQKVDGYSFQEVCAEMIGLNARPDTSFKRAVQHKDKEPVRNKEPPELAVPQLVSGKYDRVFAYLNKTRCIEPQIINYCFHQRLIYQDVRSNAVFVGYDENAEAKFFEMRGTVTYGQKFRGNSSGSDLRYSFKIECDTSRPGCDHQSVYVFEAPIDLLSHATMYNMVDRGEKGMNADPMFFLGQNRLSLSGTSDVALAAYLERNPQINKIICCLDNDEAGRTGADNIRQKYSEKGYNVIVRRVKNGKDYNESLVNHINRSASSGQQQNAAKDYSDNNGVNRSYGTIRR